MPGEAHQPKTAAEWIERHQSIGEFERVGYVGLGERYNRHLYSLRRRHFLRLAKRLDVKAPMRALDIGSGTGFYIEQLRSLGVTDITGVDISPEAVERLRERFDGCRFAVADIAASPISNQFSKTGKRRDRKGAVGIPNDHHEIREHSHNKEAPSPILDESTRWNIVTAMDVLFHVTEDDLFESALQHCAEAVASDGFLLISDNFPKRRLPADRSQAYRTIDDHLGILEPLGLRLRTISPVFFVSNGQVPGSGWPSRIAAFKWRLFARCLGKLIRTTPRFGEVVGSISGTVLTGIDALLQHQSLVTGYSTKIAVFVRS